MNSATWFVRADGRRWVATAAAAFERRAFAGGPALASRLAAAGIAAGAPMPTRYGESVALLDGVPMALLTWVPGAPLSATGGEQRRALGEGYPRFRDAVEAAGPTATSGCWWSDQWRWSAAQLCEKQSPPTT